MLWRTRYCADVPSLDTGLVPLFNSTGFVAGVKFNDGIAAYAGKTWVRAKINVSAERQVFYCWCPSRFILTVMET